MDQTIYGNVKYNRERLLTNNFIYTVFREIALNEDETYPTKMARDLERYGHDEITKICNSLANEGFVSKGEREKAQYYRLDAEGLLENFVKIWKENGVDLSEELDSKFSINYVRSYCSANSHSEVRDMFLDDFFTSVNLANEHEENEILEKIADKISGYDGDPDPGKHVVSAIKENLETSE